MRYLKYLSYVRIGVNMVTEIIKAAKDGEITGDEILSIITSPLKDLGINIKL